MMQHSPAKHMPVLAPAAVSALPSNSAAIVEQVYLRPSWQQLILPSLCPKISVLKIGSFELSYELVVSAYCNSAAFAHAHWHRQNSTITEDCKQQQAYIPYIIASIIYRICCTSYIKFLDLLAQDSKDAKPFRIATHTSAVKNSELKHLIIDTAANAQALKFFGLEEKDVPAIAIQDAEDQKFIKVKAEPADLAKHVADFQVGCSSLYIKSLITGVNQGFQLCTWGVQEPGDSSYPLQ